MRKLSFLVFEPEVCIFSVRVYGFLPGTLAFSDIPKASLLIGCARLPVGISRGA